MNNFISTVAVSYMPIYDKAVENAKAVGLIETKKNQKEEKS
ncbi:hypothetical protein L1279_001528 [Planomicrobium sp. HSC-17F08]|nr:hypothetical protein [Planomicrobium sp. HSC-17F08]